MATTSKKARVKAARPSIRINGKIRARSDASGPVLGRLLHDVARLRRRAFNILSEPSGLTRSQYWLLAFIDKNGSSGLTQSQIAAELDIGKVAVGSTIDRLVARDLVRRGVDISDRRIKPLLVTPKGRKALDSMAKVRPMIDDLVFRGMHPDQQVNLIENLSHVRLNLVTMLEQHESDAKSSGKRKRARKTSSPEPRTSGFRSFG